MFSDICWDIASGQIIQEFQNWGKLYKIEFELTVTHRPQIGFTNVFHVTAKEENSNYGDRIPTVYINSEHIQIASAVNGNKDYSFWHRYELERKYKFIIQQFKVSGSYWYEIIKDGVSELKIPNTQPQSFSNVKLYGSNPWWPSFYSNLGTICNFQIEQHEG